VAPPRREVRDLDATTAPFRAPSCERAGRRIPALRSPGTRWREPVPATILQHAAENCSPLLTPVTREFCRRRKYSLQPDAVPKLDCTRFAPARELPCPQPVVAARRGRAEVAFTAEWPLPPPPPPPPRTTGRLADGQMSASRHAGHFGLRAVQTFRPCRIRRKLNAPRSAA